ncbi:MAG: flagellin [Candidatus Velthaea sp.]
MSISLVNNLLAGTAQLNLSKNQAAMQDSVTKLSSGLRINTAADDPSGLAIAEQLQSQVNGFDQAVSNVQDATNAATTADGALQTTTDILQRIRSLAVEASSDTNTQSDKANLQTEVTQLLQEVNTISQNTNFNGSSLLDGSHSGFQPTVQAFTTITSNASLAAATTSAAGVSSGLLVASVVGGTGFQTSTAGAQGITGAVSGTMGTGAVDGTIQLQVINTGTSIAVQETFVASNSAAYGSSVATTLLSANASSSIFDSVTITTGNFTTADVGVTSYIKVSQNVPLVSSAAGPAFSFQSGSSEGSTIQMGIQASNSATLRISNINLLVSTSTGGSIGAQDAIGQIDNALSTLLTERANLGAVTVRLQEDSSNDSVAANNLQASESNIRDLNVSAETTKYTADQILISVGTSVLLQSNNNAQSVERLFQ